LVQYPNLGKAIGAADAPSPSRQRASVGLGKASHRVSTLKMLVPEDEANPLPAEDLAKGGFNPRVAHIAFG
jgi:hypothetical protein